MKTKSAEVRLKGLAMSRGIAIGKPFFFTFIEDDIPERSIPDNLIESEVERYRSALKQSELDVRRLQDQLKQENALEAAAILETHLQIMQDPLLTTMIESEIRKTKRSADSVFHTCHIKYRKKFHSIRDPFFRERDKDLEDISRRIISHLRESVRITLAEIPQQSIVIARDLVASDTAEAKPGHVEAFLTQLGGINSHAAIVARAKGMPFVTKVNIDELENYRDCLLIVDGRSGDIIINPSARTLQTYQNLKKQLKQHLQNLEKTSALETETFDGFRMRLSANIETISELDFLHQYRASGVGLFRSEYIFLSQQNFPSEDEQYEIYKKIVEKMKGLPIVIRTFDMGGDKLSLHQNLTRDVNPYMSSASLRLLLKDPEVFKTQLKAILRASVHGDVSIMFPMISGFPEIVEAKKLVYAAQSELHEKGLCPRKPIRIGCMIEVPSAAIIADLLAKECDFLSIGTNDLVQYSLAIDRTQQNANSTMTPMHPSVVRLIKLIVTQASLYKKPVTVCGEIAADPRYTPLLMGLGVHELSVASRHLPYVKNAIRNTSMVSAVNLAEKILQLTSSEEIQNVLGKEYQRSVPEDFFHHF
jgi:phosphotransferase system enzyme I (PtsI)